MTCICGLQEAERPQHVPRERPGVLLAGKCQDLPALATEW